MLNTFVMSGGKIYNNTVIYGYGGGVDNEDRSSFVMSGGVISNNTAWAGGGVSVFFGKFTMSGGVICNNTATGAYGGGVYFHDGMDFSISGGMISNNTALTNGGGVYYASHRSMYELPFYSFMMSGGVICGNTAFNSGGGVYIVDGLFRLSDGEILENTALYSGGGVWTDDRNLDILFVSDGVVFSGNRASVARDRDSVYDEIYSINVGGSVVWSEPFVQGYNNYDIGYTYYVTVSDSFTESSGKGLYATGESVTINAGTRNGYTFYNWGTSVDVVQPTSPTTTFIMPANDIIVTANWLLSQYSINYLLDGGSANNLPWSYNVENSFPITITNPTRTGYEFLGWTVRYANGTQLTSQISYRIPICTTGNVELTANWRAVDTGNGSGGGGSGGGGKPSPSVPASSPSVSVPSTPAPSAPSPSPSSGVGEGSDGVWSFWNIVLLGVVVGAVLLVGVIGVQLLYFKKRR
jgi:uncharacterized repeat protein (TIGR02543 family)